MAKCCICPRSTTLVLSLNDYYSNSEKNCLNAFDVRKNCLAITIDAEHDILLHPCIFLWYPWTSARERFFPFWREKCCIPWYCIGWYLMTCHGIASHLTGFHPSLQFIIQLSSFIQHSLTISIKISHIDSYFKVILR